jgi:hypothetical protein
MVLNNTKHAMPIFMRGGVQLVWLLGLLPTPATVVGQWMMVG